MDADFNGAELRLARIFSGLALEDVATRVGKTRQYLHKLETGQATPTSQLVEHLASALQVEPSFFSHGNGLIAGEEQFHFRKLFTTRVMVKQVAMARGELIGRLVTYLDHELRLPELRITESQANRFASALLVPRTMMAKLFPRPRGTRLDWAGLS